MQGYILYLYTSKFANITISKEAVEILEFFIYNHELTAYKICKLLEQNNEKISYKNTHKKISNLLNLGLIEKTREEFHQHGAIYFKISQLGLLYYLSFGEKSFHRIGDFERFKDDAFFKFFVWPYFNRKTIFKLKSETSNTSFLKYFRKICDEIKEDFIRLDKIMEHDKYVDVYILNWSEFSRAFTDEYSADTIHSFLLNLKEYFNLDLINNNKDVKIEIASNDRIILFSENNRVELVKDDSLNEVKVLHNNEILETYVSKKLTHKNWESDYGLFLRINISIDYYLKNMISTILPDKIKEFVRELSLSLIKNYDYALMSKLSKSFSEHDKEILKKDAKFMKVLNETKRSFDVMFEEFIGKI